MINLGVRPQCIVIPTLIMIVAPTKGFHYLHFAYRSGNRVTSAEAEVQPGVAEAPSAVDLHASYLMTSIRRWFAVTLICLLQCSVVWTVQSAEKAGDKASLIYWKA